MYKFHELPGYLPHYLDLSQFHYFKQALVLDLVESFPCSSGHTGQLLVFLSTGSCMYHPEHNYSCTLLSIDFSEQL